MMRLIKVAELTIATGPKKCWVLKTKTDKPIPMQDITLAGHLDKKTYFREDKYSEAILRNHYKLIHDGKGQYMLARKR